MDLYLIRWVILGLWAFAIGLYFKFYLNGRFGTAHRYNKLMELFMSHKDVFEKHGYMNLDYDFKERILPDIKGYSLYDISSEMGADGIEAINALCRIEALLRNEEKAAAIKAGRPIRITRIRDYIHFGKVANTIIISFLVLLIGLYIGLWPVAKAQKLSEYKKAGIESLDERYLRENKSIVTEAVIVDRFYESRFFGGAYYKLELQLTEPYAESFIVQVDPVLYGNKKIGDTLKVEVDYSYEYDRLHGTEDRCILSKKLLE